MVYIHIRQRVADYARWKEGFDNHLAARQAGGATDEALILRNVDDPNDVIVLLSWRNLAQARTFMQSVSLQAALQQMGVVGMPEGRFWEAVE
jgi:hypothetical protein